MRTLTLKTDDRFFDKVTKLAKRLHLSKSELIRRAISEYEESIRRKELKEQIKAASFRVRESNRRINESFDDTLEDGLCDV
ncbi:hypothetical protein NNO_1805 [Hydrogenimonas sp.]|nr:hypothetical protein NNO_1805 [Hydrogenimonas sp.]